MRRTLLLLAIAASVTAAEAADWRKLVWVGSHVYLAYGQGRDIRSSWGRPEANPVLGAGQPFGARGAAVKGVMLSAALPIAQSILLRRDRGRNRNWYLILAGVNVAVGEVGRRAGARNDRVWARP